MAPGFEAYPTTTLDFEGRTGWKLVLSTLLIFRLVNAFQLHTFFQPDEYFQSLEPAWRIAFGPDSGAWITWEWREQLRSSIHPYLFAGVYKAADLLANASDLSYGGRARLLLAAPRIAQGLVAGLMDYHIWRLAVRTRRRQDPWASSAVLLLCVVSPWQWFCSTRTLVNSLECTLTAAALSYWPWDWSSADKVLNNGRNLRTALCLAAFATILRAPNVIIWIVVAASCFAHAMWLQGKAAVRLVLLVSLSALSYGLVVFSLSVLVDKRYYGEWALPPLKFLQFNVVQSLAVFYGRNRPDYYFTEGLPLLTTTALPLAIMGAWQVVAMPRSPVATGTTNEAGPLIFRRTCLAVVVATVVTLSLIPHKEVRFLYPLLPFLMMLAAPTAGKLLGSAVRGPSKALCRSLLLTMVAFNIAFAGYIGIYHQRGVIDVMQYLRGEHEHRATRRGSAEGVHDSVVATRVGFLMPCHSTPWRSHLVHREIEAWALTCEPPLNMTVVERAAYLDEADQFYADPAGWLTSNMEAATAGDDKKAGRRAWPDYLAFFGQLEPLISSYMAGIGYGECWRGFNSHFHDDWRRKGDVIVWCRTAKVEGQEVPDRQQLRVDDEL